MTHCSYIRPTPATTGSTTDCSNKRRKTIRGATTDSVASKLFPISESRCSVCAKRTSVVAIGDGLTSCCVAPLRRCAYCETERPTGWGWGPERCMMCTNCRLEWVSYRTSPETRSLSSPFEISTVCVKCNYDAPDTNKNGYTKCCNAAFRTCKFCRTRWTRGVWCYTPDGYVCEPCVTRPIILSHARAKNGALWMNALLSERDTSAQKNDSHCSPISALRAVTLEHSKVRKSKNRPSPPLFQAAVDFFDKVAKTFHKDSRTFRVFMYILDCNPPQGLNSLEKLFQTHPHLLPGLKRLGALAGNSSSPAISINNCLSPVTPEKSPNPEVPTNSISLLSSSSVHQPCFDRPVPPPLPSSSSAHQPCFEPTVPPPLPSSSSARQPCLDAPIPPPRRSDMRDKSSSLLKIIVPPAIAPFVKVDLVVSNVRCVTHVDGTHRYYL